MTTGWTGGQYSVLRVLIAIAAVSVAMRPHAGVTSRLLAGGLGLLVAGGVYDRISALGLAAVLMLFAPPLGPVVGRVIVLVPLLLHALVPPAPYGSWMARHRLDPAGGWWMPPLVPLGAWMLIATWHGLRALESTGFDWVGFRMAGILVPFLAISARTRPIAWTLAVASAIEAAVVDGVFLPPLLALHGFAFDPAWIPPATRITPATVFYDGACGLCHRAVRFILAEDRRGTFRLAPLDGAACARALPANLRSGLPDSIVVCAADGRILVRAEGVNEVGAALGGLWRLVAEAGRLIPRTAGDRAYDWIASVRHRLFTPPDRACPLVPEHLHARFADGPEDHPAASARR